MGSIAVYMWKEGCVRSGPIGIHKTEFTVLGFASLSKLLERRLCAVHYDQFEVPFSERRGRMSG